MMKHLLLSTAVFFGSATLASAHDYKAGSVHIDHPHARATGEGAPVSGGYMTITNEGAEADRLIGGKADFAGKVEIHEMKLEDNVMKMRPIEGGLEVPAEGAVVLKPGGYHVMFMELKEQLKKGESGTVTLTFEKAGDVEVEFMFEDVQKHGGIAAFHPQIRATPTGAPVSGGYVTLRNNSKSDDKLVAASVDFAERVEIHEMKMENDVMQMRPIESLPVKAGSEVVLNPGGHHLMFMGLKDQLKAGQSHKVTLEFEKAGKVDIPFSVDLIKGPSHLAFSAPMARATKSGAPVSGGYLTIKNLGVADDRLVAASAPFAGKTEIHEMKLENEVMQMRPIEGLEIKAGGEAVLKPGGYHLMFMKLGETLEIGQTHNVTLEFEKAGKVEVEFVVQDVKKNAHSGGHAHGEKHNHAGSGH